MTADNSILGFWDNLPLVLFTYFAQVGLGVGLVGVFVRKDLESIRRQRWIYLVGFICLCIALFLTFFHFGEPSHALNVVYGLGTSWLTLETIMVSISLGFMLVTFIVHSAMWLKIVTAVLSFITIFVQGLTYAAPNFAPINNAFPFTFFLLSAIAMGSSLFYVRGSQVASLTGLISLLVTVPCVWSSGSEVMLATSYMWAGSVYYWSGLTLLSAALFLNAIKKNILLIDLLLIFIGLFLVRITFFASTPIVSTLIEHPVN